MPSHVSYLATINTSTIARESYLISAMIYQQINYITEPIDLVSIMMSFPRVCKQLSRVWVRYGMRRSSSGSSRLLLLRRISSDIQPSPEVSRSDPVHEKKTRHSRAAIQQPTVRGRHENVRRARRCHIKDHLCVATCPVAPRRRQYVCRVVRVAGVT